jgi:hypothetical protein
MAFTVKMYRNDARRILEADRIQVQSDNNGAIHRLELFRGDAVDIYYVGPCLMCPKGTHEEVVFDMAFIENSSGKTTETIRSRALVPELRRAK